MSKAKKFNEGTVNHYYKLAAIYFQRFEKSGLFPKLSDASFICFGVFSSVFLLCVFLILAPNVFSGFAFMSYLPSWLLKVALYAFEIGALFSAAFILKHKQKALAESLPYNGMDGEQKIQHAKKSALIEITGRPSSDFLELLQDIKKLQALGQEHRSNLDPEFWRTFWTFFTHPIWARLVSALLAVVAFLVGKPDKLFDINLTEILSNAQTLAKISAHALLLIALLILAFVLYLLIRQLLELASILISTKWPSQQGNNTMLNYLMRDLIKFYTPETKVQPKLDAPEQSTPPATESKSSSFLIAAVALHSLYAAWQSNKRKSSL